MNIEELKRLAEAATPGPWFCDPFKWAETIVCGAGEEIDHVFIGGPICETRNPLGIPGADPRCEQMRKANSRYIAAANPAAILELIRQLQAAREIMPVLKGLVADIQGLMSESHGVTGLHLNGDVAPWGELEPGGRFERLGSLQDAIEIINKHECPARAGG